VTGHEFEKIERETDLLTMTRLPILTLSAVNKGGSFCVETVQTMGLLIDKGIVLWNKLPPNFRGNDRRGIHAGIEEISCVMRIFCRSIH
jgi:hypothetical protein